jgi:exosortase N
MGVDHIGCYFIVYSDQEKQTSIRRLMNGQLHIAYSKRSFIKTANLFAAGYIILAVVALRNYLPFQSVNFILGLMALPFVLQIQGREKRSYRFGWIVLVCVILCFLIPVSTILYFTICFALFFLMEYFYGRVNLLAVLTVVLMSPVFQYFINTFSFPLRLELTKLAGTLFNMVGTEAAVKGNVIIHQGNEFSVDPGCMGLKMMETSLLLGVMLIGFYQKRFQRRLTNRKLLFYLGTIVLLNIIANLIRIILLVQFSVLPGTFSHELAGIVCLIVYVFLPAVWLASLISKRSPAQNNITVQFDTVSQKTILLHLLILSCISLLAVRVSNTDTYKMPNVSMLNQKKDFLVTEYAPGILKLQDTKTLVYIKYIRGFYDTDHSPMICWKGSGYVFEKIQLEKIGNKEIYTGMLVNGTEKLYSAWWYGNGHSSTVSQFEWRWDMLKGEKKYAVINVTCSDRVELEEQIKKMFQQRTLDTFFN